MIRVERTNKLEINLEEYKRRKIEELSTECNATICKGFYSSALDDEHFYSFGLGEDQTNFNQQVTLLILDPNIDKVFWKTEDAGIQVHTKEQFLKVVQDASNHKQSNIAKYWGLKSQVISADSKEDIDSIWW